MLNFAVKNKYLLRQNTDMFIYGKKSVERVGISDDLLNEITPFRRLSNKPVRLSEPEYFILNFEEERGKKYLPLEWEELSDDKKIDYIVHDRYSELVANKLMRKIQPEDLEHSYTLNGDGDIVSFDIGNENSVETPNKYEWMKLALKKGKEMIYSTRTVHNHPENKNMIKYIKSKKPEKEKFAGFAFSGGDIRNYISWNEIGYVIDTFGKIFKFIPNREKVYDDEIACKTGNFLIRIFNTAVEKKSADKKRIEHFAQDIDNYVGIEGYDNKAQHLYEEFLDDQVRYYTDPEINLEAQKDLLYAISDYGKFIQLK